MKRIILFTVLVIFILGNFGLFSKYLDVGNDPDKIKVIDTKVISSPEGYEFGHFSPNGEYFTFTKRDKFSINEPNLKREDKTRVYLMNGKIYKNFEGAALLWSPDSRSLIFIKGRHEYWRQNIFTGQKDKIAINLLSSTLYDEEYIHCFNPDNNNLIYNIDEAIYEYDFNSKTSKIIMNTENKNPSNIKMFPQGLLFYSLYNANFKKFLYRYDVRNKKTKKIFNNSISYVNYFINRTRKPIIYFYSESNKYIYFVNEKGITLFKIKAFPYSTETDWVDEVINPNFSSFAPNGEIFASSIVENDDENLISGDILFINSSGKMVNISNSKDKIEIVKGWSPLGDKLIIFEEKSRKYFIFFLAKS